MADKKQVYTTPHFRAAFVRVQHPDEDGKYSIAAIFRPENFKPEEKKRWAEIKKAMDAASQAKHGKGVAKLAEDKRGIRNGENKETEGYGPGTFFANMRTMYQPGVVDAQRKNIDVSEVYSGCYCRAVVDVYAYDNEKSKGVALGLRSIQFLKDGDPLGGRQDASEDFEDDLDDEWLGGEEDFDDAGDDADGEPW